MATERHEGTRESAKGSGGEHYLQQYMREQAQTIVKLPGQTLPGEGWGE